MPTPSYVASTDFRVISVEEQANRTGLDGLTITLKGRAPLLAPTWDSYLKGSVAAGYPYMYLDTKSSTDRGPYAEITLNYVGALTRQLVDNGRTSSNGSISRQSVTLNTDEDENVTFFYYAQQTTTYWLHYGASPPLSPKFRVTVPSTIPTAQLFGPNPPNYKGSISGRRKIEGRLAQFDYSELSRGVYSVVEAWDIMIEPVSSTPSA